MTWLLYEIALITALLGYLPKALWRRRLPHRGWSMRLGRYPARVTASLQGREALWVHAVSVGEVLAAQPLLRALVEVDPASPLVLSTITPSGFAVASAQVAGRGVPIYFPLDVRWCVTRALDAIRPRLLLLVESELWPMTIRLAHARGIPIAVVNGRLSPRAFARYRLVTPWLAGTMRRVDRWCMQSQADADRAIALGAVRDRVQVTGSMKWDASVGSRPSADAVRDTATRLGLNGRDVVIVAGSTHRGEERAILRAFQALQASHADARLILAPRHLERVAEVEGLGRDAGFSTARLSRVSPAEAWRVGIVDTLGQLPCYYGLATVVFIGGSLIPHGGQNPLEAASLGKPIVFGRSMHNFETIAHELLAHHAARQVESEQELAALFGDLLARRAEAQTMGRRAQALTERFQGATDRTLEALKPLLRG